MATLAGPRAGLRTLVTLAAICTAGILLGVAALRGGQVSDPDDPRAVTITAADVLEAGPTEPDRPPGADPGWRAGRLPDNWDARRPGYQGFVWYRLTPPTGLARLDRPALYLPAVGMNAVVYVNGRRLAGFGRMRDQVTRNFYTPLLFELPRAMLDPGGGQDEILVLVVGHPGYRCGLAPVRIGEHAALYGDWRRRGFWQNGGTLITTVINVTMGIYALLIGWRAPGLRMYAWFGAAAVVWGLRNLNYVVVDPPVDDLLWAELCVTGASCFTGLFALFAARLAAGEDPGYRAPRWLSPLVAGFIVISALQFLSSGSYRQANAGFAALALVGISLTAWSQWRLVRLAWHRREPELVAVAAGSVVYFLLLVHDYRIGIDRDSLGEIFIRQYAALPLFLAITAKLTRGYLQSLARERELTLNLQSQVDAQRRELEASFARLHEIERERALANERARLMGELHDGLGLHLITALHQARSPDAPREAVAHTLQDCLDDLRMAIDSLSADDRDPVALLGALRFRLAPRFESLGLRLDWRPGHGLGELPALDADRALDLLRIVQEALTNALKHSKARVVTISIARADEAIRIEVRDDGAGLGAGNAVHGRGLGQMRMRARRLGAELAIVDAAPGVAVRLSLPPPAS